MTRQYRNENENENSLNNILPSKKEKEKKNLNEVFQLEWCRITCFFIFRKNKYIESWWLAKRVILYIKQSTKRGEEQGIFFISCPI